MVIKLDSVRDIDIEVFVADGQVWVRGYAWRDGKLCPWAETIALEPIVEKVCAGVDRIYVTTLRNSKEA